MPVTYEIDRERGLIRTRCTGAVSFDEVMEHFRVLEREPGLPRRLDVLLDLSGIATVPDSDQIVHVAKQLEKLLEKVRWRHCAIVATRDLVFGISRVFEVRAENAFTATQVFREMAAAETWLASFREPK